MDGVPAINVDMVNMATLIRHVEICWSFFLDYLSCHIFVISILCPFDVLSVDVLWVSPPIDQ